MGRIPTVTARQSPLVGAPNSQATGEDFGAGIGRAIVGLGNTIQQVGSDVAGIGAQRAADKRALDTTGFYATHSFTEEQNNIELNHPDPTGAGLVKAVQERNMAWIDDTVGAYAESHPGDKKGADALRLKWLSQVQGNTDRAAAVAFNLNSNNAKLMSEQGLTHQINDVRSHGAITDEQFKTALDAGYAVVDAQQGFDAVSRANGRFRFLSDLSSARFDAKADAATDLHDIEELQAELGSDTWKDNFTADAYKQQVTNLDTRKNQIISGNNAMVTSTLASLTDRANAGYVIPPEEMRAKVERLVGAGIVMTEAQSTQLAEINIKNSEAIARQGLTPAQNAERDVALKSQVTNLTQATPYLLSRLSAGKPSYYITNMDSRLQTRLASLFRAGEAAGFKGFSVFSGARTEADQRRIIGNNPRPTVGSATGSKHVQRMAADLGYNGGSFTSMPRAAAEWLHANAGKYGIAFPLTGAGGTPNEPWHAEIVEARGGRSTPGASYTVDASGAIVDPFTPPAGDGAIITNPMMYRNAIGGIESDGSGGYAARGAGQGPSNPALGRYQILQSNLPSWSKAALGREVSVAEFMSSPDVQDKIFDHRFGMYVDKYGPTRAAAAWFAGEKGMGNTQAMDVLGTDVQEYMNKFNAKLGAAPGVIGGGVQAGGMDQETFLRLQVGNSISQRQDTAINNDPMTYQQNNGSASSSVIGLFSTPEDLARREEDYNFAREQLNLTPEQSRPLTNPEAAQLAQLMASGDPTQQLTVLGMFDNWSKANREAAFNQIGAKDKVVGYAADVWADDRQDLAFEIVQGRTAINGMKEQGPLEWQNNANDDFRAWRDRSLNGLDPDVVDAMKGSADAIMAHRMAQTGNSYERGTYTDILAELLGKDKANLNGAPTVLPKGLKPEVVHHAFSAMGTDDWTMRSRAGQPPLDANGQPLEGWQLAGANIFVINGEDDYRVVVDGQPVATMGPNGPEAFVLHLDPSWVSDINTRTAAKYVPPDSELGQDLVPPDTSFGVSPDLGLTPPNDNGLVVDPTLGGAVVPPEPTPVDKPPGADGLIIDPSLGGADLKGGSGTDTQPLNGAKGDMLGNQYTVVKGDNLSDIAKRFGIKDPMTIAKANGIKNADQIDIGQKLTIPGQTSDAAARPAPVAGPPKTLDEIRGAIRDFRITSGHVMPRPRDEGFINQATARMAERERVATFWVKEANAVVDMRQHFQGVYRDALVKSGKFSSDTIEKLVAKYGEAHGKEMEARHAPRVTQRSFHR